jgi:Etoposide-induced protein 2.4 (EI24)
VHRSVFALLHGREFIGLLRLPVAANALAFALLVGLGWWLLLPWFTSAFAAEWPLGDGRRRALGPAGPALWLTTSALLLGPPLLDVLAGAAQESLRLPMESRWLGPARRPPNRGELLRLGDRVRVLLASLLLWPLALGLVLVPWLGLPLVLVLGGAVAATVWFEAPMAARGLDLRRRLELLWRNRWRALGTGLALQFAAAVPFVNLLALAPVAMLAATAGYLQFDKGRADSGLQRDAETVG